MKCITEEKTTSFNKSENTLNTPFCNNKDENQYNSRENIKIGLSAEVSTEKSFMTNDINNSKNQNKIDNEMYSTFLE